ncbi:MAG: DNA polymerase III subunit gamma/tau [Gammaproteobacteria bacterium]|nr:DNA polymerase III subunit gamma/tau [Gammaproteobacteria bacterium]
MSYLVLARKWRPRKFSDMIGQAHVIRALCNALDSNRLHHAYLFTGTRGVGKTTIARLFAKSVNCEQGIGSQPCGTCSACREIDEGRFVDLIEVDAASRARVDETRDLMDNVQYAPARGRYKVYLIDEVHMFSNHSFNALLKTLEEPPPHVKFLLATTDPKKLPITVLSRCLQFNLSRIPATEIEAQLQRILDAEGIGYDLASVRAIAKAADGSDRDALSLLDQAISYSGGTLTGEQVVTMLGSIRVEDVHALIEALAADEARPLIDRARRLAEYQPDYAGVLGELLSTLQRIAVCQVLGAAAAEEVEDDPVVRQLAGKISPQDCQLYYQIGLLGLRDLPFAPDPRVGFEMTLLRMLAFRPVTQFPSAGGTPGAKQPQATSPPANGSQSAAGKISVAKAAPVASAVPKTAPVPAPATTLATTAIEPTAEHWPALIEKMGLTGLVRELAKRCAWTSFGAGELCLAVDPQFVYSKATETRLADALRAQLGASVRVQFRISAEAAPDTPIARDAAERRERLRQAEQALEQDEVVRALQADFGASIEEVTVK